MYVDYNYYSNVYQGKAKEEEFINLEIKAASTLNYYTFNRIEEVTENIKLAICELIDFIKADEDILARTIVMAGNTFYTTNLYNEGGVVKIATA